MKERVKMESLAEEMRILYVACTRPRDKLIMVGSINGLVNRIKKWSKTISPFQLAQGRFHLDWIGPVVLRHPDGAGLREMNELTFDFEEGQIRDYGWQVQIISRSDRQQEEEQKEARINFKQMLENCQPAASSSERESIWQKMNWQYPFGEAVGIPSKLSVSQIKQLQGHNLASLGMNTISMASRPRFLSAEITGGRAPALSAADRGTIMHFVMQHLDFARVSSEEEIAQQVREMQGKELMRKDEAEAVDLAKVLRFFHSPLGQRVLQAKRVYREVPFNLARKVATIFAGLEESQEDLLIQGVIDLYFREGEELVLVDYKTDWITPENREELIEKYRVQVELYCSALESIQGQVVKDSYLYLFDSDEEVKL
jgi:ATP-dependent helicase/nuclease subunit A